MDYSSGVPIAHKQKQTRQQVVVECCNTRSQRCDDVLGAARAGDAQCRRHRRQAFVEQSSHETQCFVWHVQLQRHSQRLYILAFSFKISQRLFARKRWRCVSTKTTQLKIIWMFAKVCTCSATTRLASSAAALASSNWVRSFKANKKNKIKIKQKKKLGNGKTEHVYLSTQLQWRRQHLWQDDRHRRLLPTPTVGRHVHQTYWRKRRRSRATPVQKWRHINTRTHSLSLCHGHPLCLTLSTPSPATDASCVPLLSQAARTTAAVCPSNARTHVRSASDLHSRARQ